MVSNPEISILNLCFNTGERVLETYESIKLQTFKNFELICVDDASTDNSFDVVEQWLKTKSDFPYQHLRNETNKGIVYSLNKALSQSTGKYIACIADDRWDPQFLQIMYDVLINNNVNAGLVYAKASVYNIHQQLQTDILDPLNNAAIIKYPRAENLFKKIKDKQYLLKGNYIQDHMFWINPVISFSFLGRKELFAGGYTDKYWMEDMPKWYELSKKTNFIYIDQILATYIIHGKNVTHTHRATVSISVLNFLKDNFDEIRFDDTRRKVESRIAFMFIDKELSLEHIGLNQVREVLSFFLMKRTKSFFRIVYIIAKETGYKWKKKLFQL